MSTRTKAYRAGKEHGKAAGSWVFDGNSDQAAYERVVKGYDDGDPEIMDMCPSPLSGEWAGESISELSSQFDIDLEDDDKASDFEDGFADGYWGEVLRAAKVQLA